MRAWNRQALGIVPQLLVGGLVLLVDLWQWPGLPELGARLVWIPVAAAFAGLVTAWQFNRERLFFGVLIMGAAYTGLVAGLWYLAPVSGRLVFGLIALLVPVDLLVSSHLPRHGIKSYWSGIWFGCLLLQLLWVLWLLQAPGSALADWLYRPWFRELRLDFLRIPQLALPILLAALLWFYGRLHHAATPTRMAYFAGFLLFVLALLQKALVLHAFLLIGGGLLLFLLAVMQESRYLFYYDVLTGLPARRALEERLQRLGGRYALAMIDIDYFKRINDRYGHQTGDQVLRMVAVELERMGGGSRAYRYGGEEFVAVFPGKAAAQALAHAEQCRTRIERAHFRLRGEERRDLVITQPARTRAELEQPMRIRLTVSIGIADAASSEGGPLAVLKAADQALYHAKQNGRNRSSIFRRSMAVPAGTPPPAAGDDGLIRGNFD